MELADALYGQLRLFGLPRMDYFDVISRDSQKTCKIQNLRKILIVITNCHIGQSMSRVGR